VFYVHFSVGCTHIHAFSFLYFSELLFTDAAAGVFTLLYSTRLYLFTDAQPV